MVKIESTSDYSIKSVPKDLLKGKRSLTSSEIEILNKNMNHNDDPSWSNFYVDDSADGFDPNLIHFSFFSGFIVLGKIQKVVLKYNDLHLECGIIHSRLRNIVTGDFCVVRNVSYFDNYRIGNRVILFNINEMCCTNHAKFGNGILKNGEPEEHRIWIGVANENEGRKILPFESMIPADAFLWSHYRDDKVS